jgi:formiminotetrahydrofolate cyclodeaminase
VSAALGSGLVAMLANLSVGKKQCPEQEKIQEILAESEKKMNQLLEEAQKDMEAYDQVMTAYGLPKETDLEKEERSEKIQLALKNAAEAPLSAAKICLEVLQLAKEAARIGNPNVTSDAVAGGLLAEAAMQAILLNVTVNLSLIKDEEWNHIRREKQKELSQKGQEIRDHLLHIL